MENKVHPTTWRTPEQIRRRQMKTPAPRIHKLYSYRNHLDTYNREVLSSPIVELLSAPMNTIETWIATNERLILEGVKRAATQNKFETKSIKTFYQEIPQTLDKINQMSIRRQIRGINTSQLKLFEKKTVAKHSLRRR
jgi:hypothetical protein